MIEAWNAMILEFLSTPSARRATLEKLKNSPVYIISIHALREEGDEALRPITREQVEFLSTPSARRATILLHGGAQVVGISIHALREEGDR